MELSGTWRMHGCLPTATNLLWQFMELVLSCGQRPGDQARFCAQTLNQQSGNDARLGCSTAIAVVAATWSSLCKLIAPIVVLRPLRRLQAFALLPSQSGTVLSAECSLGHSIVHCTFSCVPSLFHAFGCTMPKQSIFCLLQAVVFPMSQVLDPPTAFNRCLALRLCILSCFSTVVRLLLF